MQDVPRVDTPFTGLEGRLLASPHGQAVFFTAPEEFEVPAHAHGAQWGIVVTGRLHLTVDGEPGTYEPGDTYDIPSGAEHSARLEAGDRKSTRLNSSHANISYAVFCLKKKTYCCSLLFLC